MDEPERTLELLDRGLGAAVDRDPLTALSAIGTVKAVIERRQRQAVRAAVQEHSWAEIGDAMGVSKQAAHHRFAREWAEELKTEIRRANAAFKAAARTGDDAGSATAKAHRDSLVAEFKRAARRRK
jgi:hypothetical protein